MSVDIRQLLVIDHRVQDSTSLLAGLDNHTAVLYLNDQQDGLSQISTALAEYSQLEALQIVSHGSPASLLLGASTVDTASLISQQAELAQWREALSDEADILLYGCNVAEGEAGQAFVDTLAQLSGADVAASDDLTGAAEQGGDWQLEYQQGEVDTQIAMVRPENYQHTLAAVAFDGITETVTDGFKPLSTSDGDYLLVSENASYSSGSVSTPLANESEITLKVDGSSVSAFDFNDIYVAALSNVPTGIQLYYLRVEGLDSNGQVVATQLKGNIDKSTTFSVTNESTSLANGGNGYEAFDLSSFIGVEAVRISFSGDSSLWAMNFRSPDLSNKVEPSGLALNNLDNTAQFTESDAPVAVVLDDDAAISHAILDAENNGDGDYAGTTLTVSRNGGADSSDSFSFDTNGAAFTLNGAALQVGVDSFATFTSTGGTLTVTFSSTGTAATSALVNDVLQRIQYTNTSDALPSSVQLDYSINDGSDTKSGSVTVNITAENDAPILADTEVTLTAINENAGDDDGDGTDGDNDANSNTDNAGDTVATILTAAITDPDGSAAEAIAVTHVDNTNGVWQYTTDDGSTWNDFTATTGSRVDLEGSDRSVLLDSANKVRFVPDQDYGGSATFTFRAWDKSDNASAGSTAVTSANGGSMAFSTATDTASVAVNMEPTLRSADLAVVSYSTASADWFTVVALANLPEGSVIHITDEGFDDAGFTFDGSEDVFSWTVPAGGIPAGTLIRFSSESTTTLQLVNADGTSDGTLGTLVHSSGNSDMNLAAGDQLSFYQTSNNTFNGDIVRLDDAGNTEAGIIYAFNGDNSGPNTNGWLDAGSGHSSASSQAPVGAIVLDSSDGTGNAGTANANGMLTQGALKVNGAVGEFDNYLYDGPVTPTDKEGWLTRLHTTSNWIGDDSRDTHYYSDGTTPDYTTSDADAGTGTLSANWQVLTNEAPAVTVADSTLAFHEGSVAVAVDAAATVNDVEGDAEWDGGTLVAQITANAEAADQLSIVDNDGDGTAITVSGTNILANGTDIGDLSVSGGVVTGGTALTITFDADATNATVQEVLQSLHYSNSSTAISASNRTVTLTATDKHGGSGSDTRTVDVTAINDQPTLTATGSTVSFIEGTGAASLFSNANVSTVEAGQTLTGFSLTVTHVSDTGNEVLNVDGSAITLDNNGSGTTATSSLGYSVAVVAGTATVTFTGGTLSSAEFQTLVDAISYQNNSDSPTTANGRVVSIASVTDSGGTSNGGTDTNTGLSISTTVNLSGTNDLPGAVADQDNSSGAGSGNFSASFSAGGSAVAIVDTDFTITDVDDTAMASAVITLTGHQDAGESITIVGTPATSGAITITYTSDAEIRLSGTASIVDYQTLIKSIVYQNPTAAGSATTGSRTVTVTVNDGEGDDATPPTSAINVVAAPIIDLNGAAQGVNATASYTENDQNAPVTLVAADASISDDGASLTGMSIHISNGAQTNDSISLAGYANNSTAGTGNAITISYGANNDTITLSGTASKADYATLLQALNFVQSGDAVGGGNRTISVGATDTDGNTSAISTITVAVTGVNDAVSANNLTQTINLNEDDGATDITPLPIVVSDTDGNSEQVTATFTLSAASAGVLASSNGVSALGSFNSQTGVWSMTGTETEINSALNALTFTPAANWDQNLTIAVNIADGGEDNTSAQTGTLTLNVTAAQDAPTAADTVETVPYNGSYTFTADDFGFSDPDTGAALDHITLKTLPTDGSLYLNGSALITPNVDVSLTDLNNGNLSFRPENGGSGNNYTSFTFTVNDGTDNSVATTTVTLNVATPSAPPATTPPPTTETVDGVTVEKETTTENGKTVSTVTVAPVSGDRTDTDSNDTRADVPLRTGESGESTAIIRLPSGIGMTAYDDDTASSNSSLEDLVNMISAVTGEGASETIYQGSESFLAGLGQNTDNLWANKIKLSTNSDTPPDGTIAIQGNSNSDSQEALVIDATGLVPGTVLELQDVDFAVVVGEASLIGGAGQSTVYAGAGNQSIVMGAGDDQLYGGDGDDTVGSSGGDDLIFGENGNDTLFGGEGRDQLHGGRDNDIVTFDGNRDDYIIEQVNGVVTIRSKANSDDVDTLINVENIQFGDQTVAISYDSGLEALATLYQNTLGRQADGSGFQWWAESMDNGLTLGGTAVSILRSSESEQRMGNQLNALSTEDQVEALYTQILGRASDAEGKAFWLDALNSGSSLEQVAEGFVRSVELTGQYLSAEEWNFFV